MTTRANAPYAPKNNHFNSLNHFSDGWLSYTELNITDVGLTGGFDSFTSTMSVPDTPAAKASVLYFFPGP